MKFEGEHSFQATRDQVWKAVQDPQILARTLPGARRLEEKGNDEYAITVAAGVGSVKAVYDGTFSLTDKHEPESCTVRASARGSAGSVDTTALMRLDDGENGGARMHYEADAKVTGALAGVGQRLIGAAAKKTTKEFLEALDREITQPEAAHDAEKEVQPAGEGKRDGTTETAAGKTGDGSARVFAPSPTRTTAAAGGQDWRMLAAGVLGGYLLAFIGIAYGRWTARRRA
jgi:carbon monoxide dehydrogenase subunit G